MLKLFLLPRAELNVSQGHVTLELAAFRLYRERARLSTMPDVFSQGRTLGLIATDSTTVFLRLQWLASFIRLLVYCTHEHRASIVRQLRESGARVDETLTLMSGTGAAVAEAIARTMKEIPLPKGWEVISLDENTSDSILAAVQSLQINTGITPLPAWYLVMRNNNVRTLMLRTATGGIAGVGSVQMMPAGSLLHGSAIALGICISKEWRGHGMGRYLNCALMQAALQDLGAKRLMEIVEFGNKASEAINHSAGLLCVKKEGFVYAEWSKGDHGQEH